MLRKTYLSFLPIAILASYPNIASAQGTPEYEITSFSESLSTQVNVSGGVLVSYQMVGSSSKVNNESLYIARTQNIKNLNVHIKSNDGNYEAKFKVTLLDSDKKWLKINFPTQHQKKLKNYNAQDVSVLAYVEIPSKRRKKLWNVLPTSWGIPIEEQQYFNVNSSGDFAKYIYKNLQGQKIETYCAPIENNIQTAFNYRCPIENRAEIKNQSVTFVTEIDGKTDKYRIW